VISQVPATSQVPASTRRYLQVHSQVIALFEASIKDITKIYYLIILIRVYRDMILGLFFPIQPPALVLEDLDDIGLRYETWNLRPRMEDSGCSCGFI
jgi:hypothetical protein